MENLDSVRSCPYRSCRLRRHQSYGFFFAGLLVVVSSGIFVGLAAQDEQPPAGQAVTEPPGGQGPDSGAGETSARAGAVNTSSGSDPAQPQSAKSVNEQILDLLHESGQIDDERYRDLRKQAEQEEAKLAEEQAGTKAETQELREDFDGLPVVIPGTSGATVVFSGRIHLDYWGFPNTNSAVETLEGRDPRNRAGFRRVRFGAKGDIKDSMTYKVEIEFASPDDTEWRDVYFGFKKLPWLQKLLMGNQKRPYGLDHLNSSRFNIFMERPMFIDAFNDDARRLGAAVYGTTEDTIWNWRAGVYSGDKIQDSDAFYKGDHFQPEFAGRLAVTPWFPEESKGADYLHVAVSGTYAFPDGSSTKPDPANTARFRARPEARSDERWVNTDFIGAADTYELIGFETVFNLGRMQLVGEFQHNWTQREDASELSFWGAYGQVAFFLTDDYMPWSRKSGTLARIKPKTNFFVADRVTGGGDEWGWGAWQVAFRYSYSDMSNKDVLGGVGQNLTAGMNWYWNPNSRMQFNYIHGWIDESGTLLAAGGSQRAEYDIVGMRFMVDF